jgi:transcriptional regulator with XRE-family HTH domain
MRRRPASGLREEIIRAFRDAMARRKLTVAAAARDIGVSRQSMHKYLSGASTPGSDVMQRACSRWGLSMTVNGIALSRRSFERPGGPSVGAAEQLSLPNVLESLTERDLEVKIIRVARESLELKVSIKFGS